jgi:hypothetical protein
MRNDLEKQVREKMEELRFQPTEPVWQNIHQQIQQKKDRRRLLLWIPVLLLLVAAGWFAMTETANDQDAPQGQSAAVPSNTVQQSNKQVEKDPSQNQSSTTQETTTTDKEPVVNETISQQQSTTIAAKTMRRTRSQFTSAKNPFDYRSTVNVKVTPGKIASTTAYNEQNPSVVNTEINAPTPKKDEVIPAPANPDSNAVVQTPASTETAVSEKKISKSSTQASAWNFAVHAGAGTSGLMRGLDVFGTREFADLASGPSPNPAPVTIYTQPSNMRNALSLSAGFIAEKQLSDRFYFSTGISYQQYRNTRAVGNYYTQDSVTTSGTTVRQFYSNSIPANTDYTSKSHFISLPLQLGWKINRSIPLYLEAGLQIQQLLGTNALIYDRGIHIYYKDKNAITSTQFVTSAGLYYSLFSGSKHTLQLGPNFMYSISSFSTEDPSKNLYSLGVQARWYFNKK